MTPPLAMATRLNAALAGLAPHEYCRVPEIPLGRAEAGSPEASDGSAERPQEPEEDDLPPGHSVVVCGPMADLTEDCRVTYDRLSDRQEEVVRQLRAALIEDYRTNLGMIAMDLGIEPGERPYLPRIATGDELDGLVRVHGIYLHGSGRVGLVLEVAWDEEARVGVRIEDGRVAGIGHDSLACE